MGFGQKTVVVILLTVVLVPPLAGFYSYFSGVPLHLLASTKEEKRLKTASALPSVSLVSGQAHTLEVPEEVCAALGIRKGEHDAVAVAQAADRRCGRWCFPVPRRSIPLALPASALASLRPGWCEMAQVWDYSRKTGQTEYRELRPGDSVSKGDLLGVFYSVDVGSKKNDLLQALVQLELDQEILDRVEKNRDAIPEVMYLTYVRSVQGDRTEINRALNNLKLWDIPQEEIDALHAEAKKISADKDAWSKTPEGRWVNREKQARTAPRTMLPRRQRDREPLGPGDLARAARRRHRRTQRPQGRDGGGQHGQPVSDRRREPPAGHRQLPRGCVAVAGVPRQQ